MPPRRAVPRFGTCAGRAIGATALVAAIAWAPALPARAQSGDVQVADNAFTPGQITRDVGATVTWVWTGANPHTVTSSDGRFPSSAQQQGAGNTHSARFTQPGTYPYFCTVHGSSMSGSVVIRQAPPPPSPSPTRASPRPAPSPTRTSARPTATASPARSTPAAASTSASTGLVAASRAPSPSPVAPAPATSASRAAAIVAQSGAPTAFPSSSTVPSPTSEPLAVLDEPLPKDRSGLAIGLGLLAAAVGFGTAGTLLLRSRRTRFI